MLFLRIDALIYSAPAAIVFNKLTYLLKGSYRDFYIQKSQVSKQVSK